MPGDVARPFHSSPPKRRYSAQAADYLRAALAIGPLIRVGRHWWFRPGRKHHITTRGRMFNSSTVKKLIASGEARRIGDMLFRSVPQHMREAAE